MSEKNKPSSQNTSRIQHSVDKPSYTRPRPTETRSADKPSFRPTSGQRPGK